MSTPIQPGQPFRPTAKEWNDVRAAAQIVLGGMPGGNVFQGPRVTDEQLSVRAKNTVGDDLERFRVLAIDGIVFNLEDNKEGTIQLPCMKLREIEGAKDRGNIVVLQSPMKENAIEVSVFTGLTAAYVTVSSAMHEFIDVGSEPQSFVSGSSGGVGRILWKPAGTGESLCMVLIHAAGGVDTKIFRSPDSGIAGATYTDDELAVAIVDCVEYVWNSDNTKLEQATDGIAELTFSVANYSYGRVPAKICIPPGFDEGADICSDEEEEIPEVAELDPPCDVEDRNFSPYFFLAAKNGEHYIPIAPFHPTKRIHLLQKPQLSVDYFGSRELVFPVYEARIPVPIHDGCVPLPLAACGVDTTPIPCEPTEEP